MFKVLGITFVRTQRHFRNMVKTTALYLHIMKSVAKL